jgi:hypothetical protein
MPNWLKGLITAVLWAGVPVGVVAAVVSTTDKPSDYTWLVVLTAVFGLLYGLEAGIMTIYNLNSPVGWISLVVDMTWSLPNTVWGFVIGNLIFWFFGEPSRTNSADEGWVSFKPRSATGFGNGVKQTHGTLNIGGAGQHEKMHLLQARIFGPAFLPIYFACYVVTSVIQLVWTGTLGWILLVAGVRSEAPLQPSSKSVVKGFFGWIYYATLFELWAYHSGNP